MHRIGLFLLGLLLTAAGPAPAQPAPDSLRAAALRDYHGPDLRGKDGPLAKAGLDLLLLYHEYRAAQGPGPDTAFTPRVADVRTKNGRVGIEAVAADSARALLEDLRALGLTGGVTAGRLVSGWLPIEQIPAMARLPSLRGLIPSQAQTRDAPSQGRAAPSGSAPVGQDARAAPAAPDSSPPGAGAFVLVLAGVVLAVEASS
jgi:hypothetical protein